MKRFTEALKWRDPWFRGLSVDGKLAFYYLCDNCDAAGVWEPDFQLANFCLKRDVDWAAVRTEFGNRLEVLPCGKWWLTRFVGFQYGPVLNPKNTAHVGVIRRLEASGIDPKTLIPAKGRSFEGPLEAPYEGAKDKDKDKDKGIGAEPDLFSKTQEPAIPYPHIVAAFHDLCPALPRVTKINDERRKAMRARWLEAPSEPLEWFQQVFRKAQASDFLSGRNAEWTGCCFDWLLSPTNSLKVIEGNYDNKPNGRTATCKSPDIYVEPPDWRARFASKFPDIEIPATWNELSSTIRNALLQ